MNLSGCQNIKQEVLLFELSCVKLLAIGVIVLQHRKSGKREEEIGRGEEEEEEKEEAEENLMQYCKESGKFRFLLRSSCITFYNRNPELDTMSAELKKNAV